MTDLRALAAGVICVGFDGTRIDSALEAQLRATPFAGLILFARNIESLAQTRALTDQIREIYRNPVIAIDQEGGRVARLRQSVEELPAMMAVAATGDLALAHRAGAQLGFDLRRAGVNLDFAPVLDLALFRMNTVIGARSFGDDPERVARLAGEFANGLRSQGMIPTFKHFPGHGSTEIDSHLDLPAIDLDEAMLRARDLVPFARLLPSAEALMTAHIVVRALDRERAATVSRRILTDLLREELGFRGVCFTDCMQMDAIAKTIGSAAGSVEALVAGADCVLISHSIDIAQQSIDRIVAAVESRHLPLARLQEAHDRVSALRASLQAPLSMDAAAPYAGVGREIGARAVTVIRGEARADAAQSIVLTFEGTTVEGVQGLHAEHAALPAPVPLQQLRLPLDPDQADAGAALAQLSKSGKRPIVLMRRAHVYAKQFDAVQRVLREFPDALIVSTREPFDALSLAQANHLLCTYGDDAPSLAGLSDVIFGGAPATGKLPLEHYHARA
jgi:beta-N-acetylhexosaminidase